jgi:hypothetical protein
VILVTITCTLTRQGSSNQKPYWLEIFFKSFEYCYLLASPVVAYFFG